MTALADHREVEASFATSSFIRSSTSCCAANCRLKEGFGRSAAEKEQGKSEEGELLPVDGNLKEFLAKNENLPVDPANVKNLKAPAAPTSENVSAEQRQRAEAELTTGEKLLWVWACPRRPPRDAACVIIGLRERKEPEYTLYALTNRRVLMWVRQLTKIGDDGNLYRPVLRMGPLTYYPPAVLEAGIEKDDRIPKGGSIHFRQVKVTYRTKDNKGRITKHTENHYFGLSAHLHAGCWPIGLRHLGSPLPEELNPCRYSGNRPCQYQ